MFLLHSKTHAHELNILCIKCLQKIIQIFINPCLQGVGDAPLEDDVVHHPQESNSYTVGVPVVDGAGDVAVARTGR